MNTKQKTNLVPWRLVVALGAFALVRPIVKIFGDVFGYDVSPAATMVITAVIAMIWVGVIIKLKIKRPMVVLAIAGVVYAVLSIVMAVIIQLSIPSLGDEEAKMPVMLTTGLVAAIIFNVVYGVFLGLIASIIQNALRLRR